jgi:molybdopterin-containing oxidoreductase family iron-sulfur binding subunit
MIELPVIDAVESGDRTPRDRFWRSISQLTKDPAYRDFLKEEFLPGASETPGASSRRQFLQLMGASMALAGLTACRKPVELILPYSRKPEEITPGIPLFFATAMPFRGTLNGLLVESHEGRPTKVEGNPEHPVSLGAAGVFEQASVLNLYDPDRSTNVLRDGNRSTWADFVAFSRTLEGRRVAIIADESSSPTRRAVRSTLESRFPDLAWVTHTPTGIDAEAAGMQMAYGRDVRPRYQFSRASVIVSFDADFLAPTSRHFLTNSREFADSRRLESPDDSMSRLYSIESAYSLTGAMADHRLPLRSSEIGAFAQAVASLLGVPGAPPTTFQDDAHAVAIAADLRKAGSSGVVLAGETQPPEVHALCAAINSHLGAPGNTVDLLAVDAPRDTTNLPALVQDLNAGRVDVLVMIGVNPVYDAPASLEFPEALKRVSETIHLGTHVDETAQAAMWHIPASHYLEAWGDGRALDGTHSVIQPLIAPLYDSRSDIELLNLLASGVDRSGYDLVRQEWQRIISGDFEKGWRKVLHDGFLPGMTYASVRPSLRQMPSVPRGNASDSNDVEVVFRLDPTVFDGSFANNSWLQELPDPTTKVVWDNVALMSPATADRLGLEWELSKGRYFVDVAEIEVEGRSVQLPIWVLPGHADNSISLNLGYGREIASTRKQRRAIFFDLDHYTDVYGQGPLSNGVGMNVGPLRSIATPGIGVATRISRASGGYMIATTQDHGALEADFEQVEKRAPVQRATIEEYRANPTFARDAKPPIPGGEDWEDYPALWQSQHPADQAASKDNPYYEQQWAMTIDLNACTGCGACVVACQSENNIQVVGKEEVSRGREMHWIRTDRYFVSGPDGDANPSMVFQPLPCQHCENAPCESVCPVAATVHSPDGTNQMIYNRCIGTRYCANNCPYKVRRFNFYNWVKTLPASVHMTQNPDVTVRSRGVMEKCSYCIQRIRAVNQQANLEDRAIRDGEVRTACQQSCPTRAIAFGNMRDPESEITRMRQNDRRYELLAELSVKPRTSYLGRITNPNPALAGTDV